MLVDLHLIARVLGGVCRLSFYDEVLLYTLNYEKLLWV